MESEDEGREKDEKIMQESAFRKEEEKTVKRMSVKTEQEVTVCPLERFLNIL